MAAKILLPTRVRERAIAMRVIRALDVRDLKPEYRALHENGSCDPMTGHCFNATNAFWHLMGGTEGPYRPQHVRHEDGSHWFLFDARDGSYVDLTASQFKKAPPYHLGRGAGMRGSKPDDEPVHKARATIERATARRR